MIETLQRELEMMERHFTILESVSEEQPIGIVNLSDETGYPHHKVRYSLRILEEEQLIEPTKSGAVPTAQAEAFMATHDGEFLSSRAVTTDQLPIAPALNYS